MLEVLSIIGPIGLATLVGYVATRAGLFTKADMRVFGRFVVDLALPALLFEALSRRPIGEVLNGGYLLAYLAGSLAVLVAGYAGGRRLAGLGRTPASIYAMGMTCSNSGFVGYPILLLTLAPVAGVVLALNMMVENLVIIPLLLVLTERGRGRSGRWYVVAGQAFARLASNPLVIAIAAGIAFSLADWTLPSAVGKVVELFALASSALSLFVIGGNLVGLPMRGMGRKVAPIAVGKLIVHPLAVGLAVLAVPLLGLPALEPSLRWAAVLSAAMPMMGIYTILAQAYGQEDIGAAAMLVTTVASLFTLSALLWVLTGAPGSS
jgi:predicted permease